MQTQDKQVLRYFIEEEGYEHRVYPCSAGRPTIGIGKNLEANPLMEWEEKVVGATNGELLSGKKEVDDSQILFLFWNDIGRCLKDLETFEFWNAPGMNDARQLAMLSVRFQLGAGTFRDFKPTLDHLAKGEFDSAANHLLGSLASRQTPNRYRRIAAMLKTGKSVVDLNL